MASASQELNAGVQGATGIEFQKHCAIYLFLEDIQKFEASNFFVCIEHYDDILFCHLNDLGEFSAIDVYQAKKSTDKWTVAKEEFHIILKMIRTSAAVLADPAPKSSDFKQSNTFTTNNTIDIAASPQSVRISETNSKVLFCDLPDLVRDKIKSGVLVADNSAPIIHLDTIGFQYIDLGRTAKSQINLLVGRFGEVYGNSVADHRAAITSLLGLFRSVELVFNQGATAKLMDSSKRVEKREFFAALSIITTKQKAYKLWRERGDVLPRSLEITVADREKFSVEISNAFDLFKDLNQQEHIKILRYVQDNQSVLAKYYSDEECLVALYQGFFAHNKSQLMEFQVKAAIFAAYIEVRG